MVMVNEGEGKGKTTAAIGQAVRAKGQGLKVKFAQFIKSGSSGELDMLKAIGVTVEQYGLGFTNKGDRSAHKSAAERGAKIIINDISSKSYDMLVCDEINYAVSGGFLEEEVVLKLIDEANIKGVHLVMTGRNPTDKMIEAADIVTKMVKVKHAFDKGIPAQVGIEF